jgi:hypothetical protein
MSNDWAENYIEVHKEAWKREQQEQQNVQRGAELAEAGGPDVFQKIRERIRQDLRTFYNVERLRRIEMIEDLSGGKFEIVANPSFPGGPVALVQVELMRIMIRYTHSFSPDRRKNSESKEGVLRICSDLEGRIQIYRNGNAFADESEVSEFLLKPLLVFVDASERRSGVRAQEENVMHSFKDDMAVMDKIGRELEQLMRQKLNRHFLDARKADRTLTDTVTGAAARELPASGCLPVEDSHLPAPQR